MSEKDVKKTPVLDTFGTDLTKLAKDGKLDPVIGRDKEIRRIGQILSRRKKNNAIIIGYPGIGKTVLAHGLAQKIVSGECSPLLQDKVLIELDVAALVAGTKYRGQFEERLKSIMREVEENPNIVLFIDEVHTIIGAGSASGSGDASNMIKPALSSGKMQLIGVTTQDEYQKTIEKDGALNRRFQKVILNPPSVEETVHILKQIRGQYETYHSVVFSDEVIETIVRLSERYLAHLNFPDKAIDIMDEVGSLVRGESLALTMPDEIVSLDEQLREIEIEKKKIVGKQQYEEAAVLRDKQKKMIAEANRIKEEWIEKTTKHSIQVSDDDIATVISAMSGVPVKKLTSEEHVHLGSLAPRISKRVVGQEEAVEAVVKELQTSALGIKDPNKPSVLVFLGRTGVGKTELAHAVAAEYFNDDSALIAVDMGEYGEKFSGSRLIGAPPGYTGYDEGGELTNKVKNKPYSVILLDEIEKAHPDIWNIFLNVWDKGFLNDSQGYRVDFRNCIFILTSNIGTEKLSDFGAGVGYGKSGTNVKKSDVINVLMGEFKKKIKPELFNRIDDVIIFNSLEKESLYQIIEIYLEGLRGRVAQHFQFTITDNVKDLIIKEGYDEKYGARPMKRTIKKLVENTLVPVIIAGVPENHTVNADVADGKVVYNFVKEKTSKK